MILFMCSDSLFLFLYSFFYLVVCNRGEPRLGVMDLRPGALGFEQRHENILDAVLNIVGRVFQLKSAKTLYVFSVKMPEPLAFFCDFIFLQNIQFQIIPYIFSRRQLCCT